MAEAKKLEFNINVKTSFAGAINATKDIGSKMLNNKRSSINAPNPIEKITTGIGKLMGKTTKVKKKKTLAQSTKKISDMSRTTSAIIFKDVLFSIPNVISSFGGLFKIAIIALVGAMGLGWLTSLFNGGDPEKVVEGSKMGETNTNTTSTSLTNEDVSYSLSTFGTLTAPDISQTSNKFNQQFFDENGNYLGQEDKVNKMSQASSLASPGTSEDIIKIDTTAGVMSKDTTTPTIGDFGLSGVEKSLQNVSNMCVDLGNKNVSPKITPKVEGGALTTLQTDLGTAETKLSSFYDTNNKLATDSMTKESQDYTSILKTSYEDLTLQLTTIVNLLEKVKNPENMGNNQSSYITPTVV